MGGTAPFTETSRVAAVLREWLDDGWSRSAIETSTGIAQRTLWAILTGERAYVGFDVLDKLLTGMQETYRWDEEFADVIALVAPTSASGPRTLSQEPAQPSRVRAL